MTQVTAQITPAELKRFSKALGEVARKVRGGMSTAIRKFGFDLLRDIMRKTPVDSGQARGGWMAGFDGLGRAAPSAGGSTEGVAAGRALSSAKVFLPTPSEAGSSLGGLVKADRPYFEVTNAVKHILPLEFGHSKQAPQGMVRTELRRHVRRFLAELKKAA